jgi:hypothetical protein
MSGFPINIANVINPELDNPIEYMHCLNIPLNFEDKDSITIDLPYIRGLVWTQFAYHYPGPCTEKLNFKIGTNSTNIHVENDCTPGDWHTLRWPTPSINSDLKMTITKFRDYTEKRFAIKLIGFTNLIPIESYYLLIDNNNNPSISITNARDSILAYGYNNITNNLEVTDEDYTIYTSDYYLEQAGYYSDESE